jgi:hypothetical protein
MKRKRLSFFGIFTAAVTTLLNIFFTQTTHAFDLTMSDGASSARGVDQAVTLFGASGVFTTVSNVMLFVVGAISVIMVVIGGLRYVISGGNAGNITGAKNTILYAVVGLVIAMLAYALVNFVIASFAPDAIGAGTNV